MVCGKDNNETVKTGVVLGNHLKHTSLFYIKTLPLIKGISSVLLLSATYLHTFAPVHSSTLMPNEHTPDLLSRV